MWGGARLCQHFSRGAATSVAVDQARYLDHFRGAIRCYRRQNLDRSAIPRNYRRHNTANNGPDHLSAPPGAPPGGAGSLARAAASGTKWMAVAQAGRVIAQLLGMVILARLLSPSDFGVAAMAWLVTGFVGMFHDCGTKAAVIQRRELPSALLDSVFWLNVGFGLAIAILLALLAPVIALAMREPQLTGVLWLLALAFPIVSLGLVHQGLLERASRFRSVALIECCAAFAGLTSAVLAALAGWGVYSLISHAIVGWIVVTAGLWAASTWRPAWRCSLALIREIAGFSGNLVGFDIFSYFARRMDIVLIGRFLGATELGYYHLAYRLMIWPLQQISGVVGRAFFPALSRLQDDKQRLRLAYVRAAAAVFLITAPLTLGMFALREPLVLAVMGERWLKVADLLFWFAPVSMVQSVVTTASLLYVSTGRTDVMFKFGVLFGVAVVFGTVVGLQWGVEGVAAAYCATALILFWPRLAVPFRLVGLSVPAFLRRLLPTFFTALLMALLVAAVSEHSAVLVQPQWARLVLLVTLGAALYFAVSIFVQRALLKDITGVLFFR
jgi:O-antigen/teichoic acid export membrane protein